MFQWLCPFTGKQSGRRSGNWKTLTHSKYRAFSHDDVTAAILVYQNNETAAVLVYQILWELNTFLMISYVNTFSYYNKICIDNRRVSVNALFPRIDFRNSWNCAFTFGLF